MQPHDLIDHPEGGRFREVFRSSCRIIHPTGQDRSALSHIYFALDQGDVSRFHKVAADEVWNLYRGDGLRLHIWDEAAGSLHTVTLCSSTDTYCHVVPGGFWQAAEPLGTTVLVGCTVAPGFEFEDFELMDPGAASARALLATHPELTRFTVA